MNVSGVIILPRPLRESSLWPTWLRLEASALLVCPRSTSNCSHPGAEAYVVSDIESKAGQISVFLRHHHTIVDSAERAANGPRIHVATSPHGRQRRPATSGRKSPFQDRRREPRRLRPCSGTHSILRISFLRSSQPGAALPSCTSRESRYQSLIRALLRRAGLKSRARGSTPIPRSRVGINDQCSLRLLVCAWLANEHGHGVVRKPP